MTSALITDATAFVVLFAISAWLRRCFKHHGYSATGAGGIVMSTGIFTAFAFTQLPFYSPFLGRLATIEIFIIWLFLARSFLASLINRHFRMHYAHPLRRFAIGTWVAATAVLATLAARTIPEVLWFSRALTLIAVIIYVPYVLLFVRGYIALWRRPFTQRANGVILLATVSTQSIIIALHTTFGAGLPSGIAFAMLLFDSIFLVSGLLLITLHYFSFGSWFLAIEWKNANCIIHGAVSISGLALVLLPGVDEDLPFNVWRVALLLFIVIEAIEFIRMLERGQWRGWRPGLVVYDVTQWTRNFTFGMFYAFSLELYRHLDQSRFQSTAGDAEIALLHFIVDWGQYVVLAILIIEMTLFLRARLYRFRPAGAHAGRTSQ